MIHLFNVERDENYIWCNYYPESRKEDIGFIKLDRKNDYAFVEEKNVPMMEKQRIITLRRISI